jgi:microcystin-dependent protein
LKKLLGFVFSLWASIACANVPCSVPFNLQNNTVADATQVMANYNALITCLGNAAVAGSNNDITQLLALSSPLAPIFGGASSYFFGTSTGSANVQSVGTTPTGFALVAGYQISFTAGLTNTGPATLNVAGTGNVSIARQHQTGISTALVGGELTQFKRVVLQYDGTVYQIVNNRVVIGQLYDLGIATCPPGTLNANSQAVSRTFWSDLFSAMGTTWGVGDGSTTFNMPDLRNRATYGVDQNVGGFSNRITVAGGNFDGTVLGITGGLQNSTSVGAHTHTITDPGHVHSITGAFGAQYSGGVSVAPFVNTSTTNTASATTGITATNSTGATYSILAPAAIVSKCIQG